MAESETGNPVVQVAGAVHRDVGKGIIRVSRSILRELGIEEGDRRTDLPRIEPQEESVPC
jgi:hypothetical protein